MPESHQAIEGLWFGFTRKIVEAASAPDSGEEAIESEVRQAMDRLVLYPNSLPKVNLQLFSAQLNGANHVLSQDKRVLRLIIHARSLVERRLQEFGPEDTL